MWVVGEGVGFPTQEWRKRLSSFVNRVSRSSALQVGMVHVTHNLRPVAAQGLQNARIVVVVLGANHAKPVARREHFAIHLHLPA